MRESPSPNQPSRALVLDAMDRLCHTKLRSIVFLERWLADTADVEIRVGLETQLIDERRHARLLAEEIKKQRPKMSPPRRYALGRPFSEFGSLDSDLHKLCVFHRGIKAFTLNRCGHLIPLVEARLAILLEQVARDEEGHIRWADIRLARLLTRDEMRSCNVLMGQVWAHQESAWEKTWSELLRSQRDFPSRLSR